MHVRVDSGLYTGYKVPPYYDSMIGKLIVYGMTREDCIMRLRRALEEYVVEGMKTTIPLHQRIVRDPDFLAGDYTIKWLEQWLERTRETVALPKRGSRTLPSLEGRGWGVGAAEAVGGACEDSFRYANGIGANVAVPYAKHRPSF
jgi:acetyl/propionyl-CoA carboxylase alpha subunit